MKKILEIGGGATPYFIRFHIPWIPGHEYISLDVEEKRMREAKTAIDALGQKGYPYPASAEFRLEDAVSISCPNESIDEVVISNVLSAPIHYNWNKKGTSLLVPNGTRSISRDIVSIENEPDAFYRERKPIVDEALRILKPGGRITIYTDLIIFGAHSYERIIGELADHPSVSASIDKVEQLRIDALNKVKMASGEYCYCFNAEILPHSSVYRFVKK